MIKIKKEERYFSWRGEEVSRTENLSDIVFALALTLVATSAVPSSFEEITSLWRDAIATALSFSALLFLWYMHYLFFRRFNLEDKKTMYLNAILIFMVMLFAYPLKFLATFLVKLVTHGFENEQAIAAVLTLEQAPLLTVIYYLGYAAVFTVFALMYHHASQSADHIGLSESERIMTRYVMYSHVTNVAFAIVVALLAIILPTVWALLVSGIFIFIGLPLTLIRRSGEEKANKVLREQ